VSEEGPSDCALCLEIFKESDRVVRMPCNPVKHYFHEGCISMWLREKLLCPLCRETVARIETDPVPSVVLIEN